MTSSLRARSTPCAACCSMLLIATKRMPGRPSVAQIAAALRVRFVAFDKRLDVSRRDQLHVMAERAQGAAPIMRRAARFDPRVCRGQPGAEFLVLTPAQARLQHDLAARILAVSLKNRLRDVEPDRDNLHGGRSALGVVNSTPAWHIRRCQGAVRPALRGAPGSVPRAAREQTPTTKQFCANDQ